MKIVGYSIAALSVMAAAYSMPAAAQNMSYGANNFYRSANLTRHPITFRDQYQSNITGNLFILNNYNRSTKLPAIVVGHPMGAVKEQSANLYAQKLAEQGFVTVSFDLPFWGGSEGQPRNGVSPDLYAEAFSAAVDYLGTLKFINRERIGAVGICGSGSFVISAAKIDSRLKAIATASMYNHGILTRNGLRNSQSLDQRKELIAAASRQRWVEVDGGEIKYTAGAPNGVTPNSTSIDREFYDFYRTPRGEVTPKGTTPNITTHPTFSSNVKFINFYPYDGIEAISPRPLLFISGDQAHSREFSEHAYSRAAEPKELYWVIGAGHVDLYDRVDLIPFHKLTQFFRENLI
ncbi:alpha/beta hydrolase [Aspergillus novofumigatus IBT 16806]|uniref:Putative alpha/beta superfamily hydrolase n=1 Tax=Aspergillus novofumigatus (strain IBT 16806) TaxID=1392255 RepID=A0A2I1BVR6_ASPN1|nr:putative alpha/beta superfamily hydrolase [Aspergillus novofumigatus IBT 16806]PKX89469.1 putative alpha/beta superfamily hydrolase [Aspergillus novofumigatus IBT 16806]